MDPFFIGLPTVLDPKADWSDQDNPEGDTSGEQQRYR